MICKRFSFSKNVTDFKQNDSCAECLDANFEEIDSCAKCFDANFEEQDSWARFFGQVFPI